MTRSPRRHAPVATLTAALAVASGGAIAVAVALPVSASAGSAPAGGVRVAGSPVPVQDRPVRSGRLSLRESVATALAENLDLKIGGFGVTGAGEDVEVAKAEFDPAVTGDGAFGFRRAPQASSDLDGADRPEDEAGVLRVGVEKEFAAGTSVGIGSTVIDRSKTNSSFARLNPVYDSRLGIDLRQPLLQGAGKASNLASLRLAGLGLERAELLLREEVNQVLLQTDQAYWNLVAATAAEDIRRRSLELADLLTEEAEERKAVNLATSVDVLEAQSSASEKREALLISENQTRQAADVLFETMGILAQTEPGDLALEPLPDGLDVDPDPGRSFALALANSPATEVLRNTIKQREVALAKARRDRLPRLDLTFGTGVQARGGSQTGTYESLAEADGYFWEAGFELRLPWGLRLEKAELAKAEVSLELARIQEQQGQLELYADIRTAARAVTLAAERIEAARVTADLSSLQFEQQKVERETGQATMRDLLEAQEQMEQAEIRVIQARVDLLRELASLAQLEGTLPDRFGIEITAGDAGDPRLPGARPRPGSNWDRSK